MLRKSIGDADRLVLRVLQVLRVSSFENQLTMCQHIDWRLFFLADKYLTNASESRSESDSYVIFVFFDIESFRVSSL